jgi:iron uptake system component EfeO
VSRPGRSARLATLAVAAIAVLAACGTSGPSAAPATPLPSGVIAVEAKEYAFAPATIAAPAGTVTFSVRNNGVQEHQFEIYSGETRVDGIDSIGAGMTKDLRVGLAAGEYTLICKLNGHDQIGMKAALTVK